MFRFFKKEKQSVIKKKPLTTETEFGTFVLRNPEKDTFYEQTMNLCGVECYVSLKVDSSEKKTFINHFIIFGRLWKILNNGTPD